MEFLNSGIPHSDRGRGVYFRLMTGVKGVKFRIFEQGPGGKFRIIDRGVGGEGGQNKLHFCLFLST